MGAVAHAPRPSLAADSINRKCHEDMVRTPSEMLNYLNKWSHGFGRGNEETLYYQKPSASTLTVSEEETMDGWGIF